MRVSCSGCRVLRKGCSEDCSIRPCLQWIKNPESQANATVFLAKFYGRAGLMNLINSGTEHLRPAIFRSLLYEACGRIVNPIYGSVGLLWSGSWQLCNAAVEAVLKGVPIMQISSEAAGVCPSSPLKSYDIRHVSKDGKSTSAQELHKVKTRSRFKRSASAVKTKPKASESAQPWYRRKLDEFNRAPSQDSLASQQTEMNGDGCSRESESMFSVETEEASLVNRADPEPVTKINEVGLDLELSLGFEPVSHARCIQRGGPTIENIEADPYDVDMHKIELGLDCPVA